MFSPFTSLSGAAHDSTNAGVRLAAIEQNPAVASLLYAAAQPAFPSIRARRPSVRIHIIGYRAWSYQMYVRSVHGGLTIEEAAIALTNDDLAGMICMPWGLHLGPTGVAFEQLFLVAVHQVSRGSIQLTLAVEL
ncbi:predicted protein [Postia placenta Mad-698-R]|uniref:Uncharacterized protein n=1 Tax=Postia placenta MAD-698-R-SB12 TaxID=670580 RepID=A0A1X6N4E4_9APHY|nr:hypothetical protein POSPLADRAFT_1139417 [Postia placenta MAD-698-R-SB12]EED84911.1 predicted protein [Postia placenta Mad-698-R]OSX63519.1 hypothetical protein POSPLADRAFT_1139417 [Postia placenta MAD-698-R-SB12]